MSWAFGILAAIFVLDGLRLRGRLSGLKRLPDESSGDGRTDLACAVSPGVELDDETKVSVAAYAAEHELDVVDIVPRDLPAMQAMALAAMTDTRAYRTARLAPGRTAGQAMAISADVRARADIDLDSVRDPIAFLRLASKTKTYACTGTDMVVVRGVRAVRDDLSKRLAAHLELLSGGTALVLGIQAAIFAILVLGVALPHARPYGLAALAAFHLQPALALLGTRLLPRDLFAYCLLRLPWEVWVWLRTVVGRWRPAGDGDPVAERRPEYEKLLGGDSDLFFEPRRETCPVCDSRSLKVYRRFPDLLQHKPGRFTLERCSDCRHIFQNPRLSIEGLDFYYKDFYDGLGEKHLSFVFGYQPTTYLARARMVESHQITPAKWLDVGAGHGHFCCVARDVLPDTGFDGLDLSESIDEAERRNWIDKGYRALFPEAADGIAESYDVVSMHHYLEHTLDPRAELAAARTTLRDGGHLLIEVPDPQSVFGKLLGKYWIPWFQPQHQHLLSVENLDKLLRANGFTPIEWHRGEAHQKVDLLFAGIILLSRLAPPANVPWRRKSGFFGRMWSRGVWTVGAPFLLLARTCDQIIAPIVRRPGASNTYRVLAQKNR